MRRGKMALLGFISTFLTLGACTYAPSRTVRSGKNSETFQVYKKEQHEAVVRAEVRWTHVWATWCGPCVDELPKVIQFAQAEPELELILVTADFADARPEADQMVRSLGWEGHHYFAGSLDESFIEAFHEAWTGALPASRLRGMGGNDYGFWQGETDFVRLKEVLACVASSQERVCRY